jgi:hypothetical protein
MTISSTVNRVSYSGNGSTTAFSFGYLFFSNADLKVILVVDSTGVETTKTITTHYTITGAGDASGGTVTMGTAPASGETLVIIREVDLTQGLDLVENDAFPSDLVEQELDRATMMAQQLNTELARSVKLSDGDTSGADPTLPTPVANAFIKWDAAGTSLESSETSAGQFLGADGTAALPYYSYSADPNSGFFRIGADNVGLSLGGTKRVDFGAATTAFTGQVTGTGFTGTLDGSLGSGTPAAAVVTQLTSGGNIVSDTDSTDDLGTTGVRWRKLWVDDVQATTTLSSDGLISGGSVTLATGATITAFLDDDSFSANSPTAGATQQSIKAYVDALVSANGGNWKASVLVATTANITLSGVQTIDGVSAVVGSRVLVKDQSTGSQNGIYVAASSTWARAADADAFSELVSAAIFVEKGSVSADTSYICTNDSGGTLGSTSVVWTQFGVGGGGGGWLGEGGDTPEGNSGDIIRINQQTLNNSVTMVATDNGSATGPLTIASGITVTIDSGATFKVL